MFLRAERRRVEELRDNERHGTTNTVPMRSVPFDVLYYNGGLSTDDLCHLAIGMADNVQTTL